MRDYTSYTTKISADQMKNYFSAKIALQLIWAEIDKDVSLYLSEKNYKVQGLTTKHVQKRLNEKYGTFSVERYGGKFEEYGNITFYFNSEWSSQMYKIDIRNLPAYKSLIQQLKEEGMKDDFISRLQNHFSGDTVYLRREANQYSEAISDSDLYKHEAARRIAEIEKVQEAKKAIDKAINLQLTIAESIAAFEALPCYYDFKELL